MRLLVIAVSASLFLLPTLAPANACGAGMHSAQATSIDYSAAKKKKPAAKKEKVEYMRAAPLPPGSK